MPKNTEREWKSYPLEGFKSVDDTTGNFTGYASTWTKDFYGDTITPGAFAQSIADKKGKIPVFRNHDTDQIAGFSNSLMEDHKGLIINASLATKTAVGQDTYRSCCRPLPTPTSAWASPSASSPPTGTMTATRASSIPSISGKFRLLHFPLTRDLMWTRLEAYDFLRSACGMQVASP